MRQVGYFAKRRNLGMRKEGIQALKLKPCNTQLKQSLRLKKQLEAYGKCTFFNPARQKVEKAKAFAKEKTLGKTVGLNQIFRPIDTRSVNGVGQSASLRQHLGVRRNACSGFDPATG
ncbi:hypothetical protein NBRC116589_13490 [Ruegeria sp. HU-ET01832]